MPQKARIPVDPERLKEIAAKRASAIVLPTQIEIRSFGAGLGNETEERVNNRVKIRNPNYRKDIAYVNQPTFNELRILALSASRIIPGFENILAMVFQDERNITDPNIGYPVPKIECCVHIFYDFVDDKWEWTDLSRYEKAIWADVGKYVNGVTSSQDLYIYPMTHYYRKHPIPSGI